MVSGTVIFGFTSPLYIYRHNSRSLVAKLIARMLAREKIKIKRDNEAQSFPSSTNQIK